MKSKLLQLTIAVAILLPVSVHASQADRPSLITEDFFAQRSDQRKYDKRSYRDYGVKKEDQIWHKILLGMGIPNPVPDDRGWGDECNAKTALSVLQDIRQELGENSTYQKLWAENQNKVCQAIAPKLEVSDVLPTRAYSDYKYQMGSFYFYRRDYKSALKSYQEVETIKDAPIRPLASYMVVRTLSYLDRKEEAYTKTSHILKDDSLKSVHDITKNYRFVLSYDSWYYGKSFTAELAQTHLRWLLDIIQVSPSQSENLDQAFADYFDALAHLDRYFPLLDSKTKQVDWWLRDGNIETPRMNAVKTLAPNYEIVDWMQSSWAYNVFDDDWLWALHEQDNEYWAENENIVQRAWSRWENNDGLEWLEIAIKRVHPNSPLSLDIVKDASTFLTVPFEGETLEYKAWLQNIWVHSIRLHIGHKKYKDAYALYDADMYKGFDSEHVRWYQKKPISYQRDLSKVIRWLVYAGDTQEARKFLESALKRYPDHYDHWRVLLAQNWSEVFSAELSGRYHYNTTYRSNDLWQKMVNTASTEELYKLAQDERVKPAFRTVLSRVAFARAMLLDDDINIDKYAELTANQNISIREDILKAVENHDRDDYLHFMLRTPRMRPVPFTRSGYDFHSQEEADPTKIDVYRHSDNNWWCAFDFSQLEEDIFMASRIALKGGRSLLDQTSPEVLSEIKSYNQNIRAILAKHPYHNLVNMDEVKALENIPSAPRYLSEAVIKQERWKGLQFWRGQDATNESASNLHYAVKTTRYGCQRNGSHGGYSQASFKILHDRYGDTIWAKITPYWFSDKHFR